MSDQTGPPPAGWYSDPTSASQQRWWDGTQWSTSTRPLDDGSTPVAPPPPTTPMPHPFGGVSEPSAPPTADEPGRSMVKIFVLGIVGMALLGGCVAVLAGGAADDGDSTAEASEDAEAETEPAEADTAGDGTTGNDTEPGADTRDDGSQDGSDQDGAAGESNSGSPMGTRDQPLPYGQPVDLTWSTFGDADGSRWTTTVGPPRDITDAVLAENDFNEAPPDGVRFVGYDVELTLIEADKEPLAPSFNFTWEILGGSTARVFDWSTIETDSFGCGVIPGQFDDFAEVFAGGTMTGTVCIPLPVEDIDHPDTRVALHFADDDRAIFGP